MKPLTPEQDSELRDYVKWTTRPRVLVRFNGGLSHWRRPFRRFGHWAVRMQGTAWLTRPAKDGPSISTTVFDVTYAPEFLER